MPLPHEFYNNPPAYMGFVGYVRINPGSIQGGDSSYNHSDMIIRATTANLNVNQEIDKPNVVDSRYDRTAYRLGPKTIDGDIEFPATYDMQNNTDSVVEAMYRYAVTRNEQGLLNPFDVDVKYATSKSAPNQADFTYQGCIANSFGFSVTNGEMVEISTNIIGINRIPNNAVVIERERLSNTRVVTWNDARVELAGGRLNKPIGGQFVRIFNVNIDNDAERFYTLNKELFAQAIAPKKRDVTGSLTLMGRHQELADMAYTNEDYCSAEAEINFGFKTKGIGSNCEASFTTNIPNVVFEIETMSLGNDLFETEVNWHSLPAAGTGINDPLLENINNVLFNY